MEVLSSLLDLAKGQVSPCLLEMRFRQLRMLSNKLLGRLESRLRLPVPEEELDEHLAGFGVPWVELHRLLKANQGGGKVLLQIMGPGDCPQHHRAVRVGEERKRRLELLPSVGRVARREEPLTGFEQEANGAGPGARKNDPEQAPPTVVAVDTVHPDAAGGLTVPEMLDLDFPDAGSEGSARPPPLVVAYQGLGPTLVQELLLLEASRRVIDDSPPAKDHLGPRDGIAVLIHHEALDPPLPGPFLCRCLDSREE